MEIYPVCLLPPSVGKSPIAHCTWYNLNYLIYARWGKLLWKHTKNQIQLRIWFLFVYETAMHLCTNAIMSSLFLYKNFFCPINTFDFSLFSRCFQQKFPFLWVSLFSSRHYSFISSYFLIQQKLFWQSIHHMKGPYVLHKNGCVGDLLLTFWLF